MKFVEIMYQILVKRCKLSLVGSKLWFRPFAIFNDELGCVFKWGQKVPGGEGVWYEEHGIYIICIHMKIVFNISYHEKK